MSNDNEPEVKIVERAEVAPAGDDDEAVEPSESSQKEKPEEGAADDDEVEAEPNEESESEEEADKAEPESELKPVPQNAAPQTDEGEIKRIPGESPKEYALRLEVHKLRNNLRRDRAGEIVVAPATQKAKPELSPEKKKVLDQYKPEDISKLRDVFDALADDMGFVKKDQLGASAYQEKASEVLDGFLEAHPEYLPQNDPDSVLWNHFKEEYSMYKPPANPKDLKKILDRVHKDVYGIKPAAALDTKEAAKKSVKVASHGSSPRPAPSREGVKRNAAPQGLRTDMLKGFSEDEIAELSGRG